MYRGRGPSNFFYIGWTKVHFLLISTAAASKNQAKRLGEKIYMLCRLPYICFSCLQSLAAPDLRMSQLIFKYIFNIQQLFTFAQAFKTQKKIALNKVLYIIFCPVPLSTSRHPFLKRSGYARYPDYTVYNKVFAFILSISHNITLLHKTLSIFCACE